MTTIERGGATIVRTPAELRVLTDAARRDGATVGFFGTNGNLHVGHLTLIKRMVSECDLTVMPLHETAVLPVPGLLELPDPTGMPRNGAADRELARAAGVDVVFMAERDDMFPSLPVQTRVVPAPELAYPWQNAEDPAFMSMTATALVKYWNIVGPCRHYLGEKDWVPLAILQKTVRDLSLPVDIVPCPIVRLDDGLCAASRNARLTADERNAAPALFKALQGALAMIDRGERNAAEVTRFMRSAVADVAAVDYAEAVDSATLAKLETLRGTVRLVVGAAFSGVHLFDNVGVVVP